MVSAVSAFDVVSPVPHVVIVGGGFGGLDAARALAGAPVRVTLVDRHNYHLFQPLLYQVATAALSPGDIASPIRWILRRQQNVTVFLAAVGGIDVAGRRVLVASIEANPADRLREGHDGPPKLHAKAEAGSHTDSSSETATGEDERRPAALVDAISYDYLILATG